MHFLKKGPPTTQNLKLSFAYTLWSWTKMFLNLDLCYVNDCLVTLGVV